MAPKDIKASVSCLKRRKTSAKPMGSSASDAAKITTSPLSAEPDLRKKKTLPRIAGLHWMPSLQTMPDEQTKYSEETG